MKLDAALQVYAETRVALLDDMATMSPAALVARPLAGRWSLLDTIEHLMLAEREVFKGLPDLSQLVEKKRGLGDHIRYRLVMFLLSSGIRVRVPSAAMTPQGNHSLPELRRLWDQNHEWLISCIDHLGSTGIQRAVLEHPVAGPLNVEQALLLGQIHVERHIQQIRVLQRLLG